MNIYTLKVTEKNTKPVIWRRIEVPGGITFSALAIILNILMKQKPSSSDFYFQCHQEGIRLCEEPKRREGELCSYDYSLQDASNTFIDDYFKRMPGFSYVYGPEHAFLIDIEGIYKQNIGKGDAAVLTPRYSGCSREAARLDPEKKEAAGISAALQEDCRIIYQTEAIFMPAKNLQKRISKKHTGLPGMKNPVSGSDNVIKGTGAYLKEAANLLKHLFGKDNPTNTTYADMKKTLEESEALLKRTDALVKQAKAQSAQTAQSPQSVRPKKLKDLLKSAIDIKDLRECGKGMLLRGYKSLSKADLAEKIANELLTKTMMQKRLFYLSDRQIATFEKAMKAGGIYEPADYDEEDDLVTLSMRWYVFWGKDSHKAVVPEDVEAAYRTWYTPQFAKKRSEVAYLLACMDVIGRYYGQISLDDFYKLVKKGSSISFDEMKQQIEYLTGIWAENGAPQGNGKAFPPDPESLRWLEQWTGPEGLCVLRGDQLIATNLLEDDQYLDIARDQIDVAPYIPSRKEILELSGHGYPAGQEECRKLRAFFEDDLGEDPLQAEDLTEDCWGMFNFGWSLKDVLEMLEEMDVRMESEKDVNKAVGLLVNLNNNTRMLHHRGHTPNEIRNMHNQGRKGPEAVLKKLGWTIPGETGPGFGPTPASVPAPASTRAPAAAPAPASAPGPAAALNRTEGKKKIYPNDPCPCGSGKKYKHCCGK